jgi:subtilisin family serine protease
MKNFVVLLLSATVAICMIGCDTGQQPDLDATPADDNQVVETVGYTGPRQEFVPGEVLVKFKSGVSQAELLQTFRKVGGEVIEKIQPQSKRVVGEDEAVTLLKTNLSVPDAVALLKQSPDVVYAEPNYYLYHNATSNDPYYTNGSLWGMYGDATSPANQYGSQAGEAWAAGKTGSNTVWIGIIDEGYMYTHEDLAANAGTNPGEIAGNGKDDDGNGYVDDVYGWDFDGNNNTVFDGTSDDHGTHVAGTIGGVGGNSKGVAGVVWNVKLMNAKFLGSRGGTTANAVKAVDYFTDLKLRHGINLVATNNSWGGGGYSQALYDAIERANQAGILFIAAAGNNGSNNDASPSYPASYNNSNIVAVASITNTGAISSFSNYGATSVDLGAPGSGIFSTVPKSSRGKIVSGYASYSGTSMATPHVTGAAALYASTHPGASASTIKNAILSSIVSTSSLANKCATGGRLNVSGF